MQQWPTKFPIIGHLAALEFKGVRVDGIWIMEMTTITITTLNWIFIQILEIKEPHTTIQSAKKQTPKLSVESLLLPMTLLLKVNFLR